MKRGWVQLLAMKIGDHLKVPLPLSHFTRALDKHEESKTEESLDTEEKVERKVASSSPANADEDFFLSSFHLRSR